MAVINKKAGYYGYTLDGGSYGTDALGYVKRCMFVARYNYHVNDVNVTISTGTNDWGAQMGDGSIIPLSNPVVLYQNKDNAVLQFDMATKYPANSPCSLVYRSDTASITITEVNDIHPFSTNCVTGNFSFTVEGYGSSSDSRGWVNRSITSFSFPYQEQDIKFTISTDPSHWGLRMGDGSIITLRSPQIIATNQDNAVVVFTMDSRYPSNSPCILVYRSAGAWYKVETDTTPKAFVPVTNIIDVPTTAYAGIPVDLSVAGVEPWNATNKDITWSKVSGNCTVSGNTLTPTGGGNLVIRGTVVKGASTTANYTKDFTIVSTANVITITAQPTPTLSLRVGSINQSINVVAKSTNGRLSYQWYQNSSNSYTGATAITGATSSKLAIPTALTKGTYYFFCKVSSPGATSVNSSICTAKVSITLTGITINEKSVTSIQISDSKTYTVSPVPANADLPSVVWSSSNTNILSMSNGVVTAIDSGSATITVRTTDGKFSDTLAITVPVFVSVTDITGIITRADTGTDYTLNGTVAPSNASNKTIVWSVASAGDTGATISNGKFRATTPGTAAIRATITHGTSPYLDYVKTFYITVVQGFIPVTNITLNNVPSTIRVGDSFKLSPTVTPSNASNKVVTFTITSGGSIAAISGSTIAFSGEGSVIVRATVKNGKTASTDFVKDFPLTVNSAWVPVESVTITPTEYDPHVENVQPAKITVKILPENATSKVFTITMTNAGDAKCAFNSTKMELTVPDPSVMTSEMNAFAEFRIVVTDGIAQGNNYITDCTIKIASPPPPEVWVPVTNLVGKVPNPPRAFYPIIPSKFEISPWNASGKRIFSQLLRTRELDGVFGISFVAADYTPDTSLVSEFFDFTIMPSNTTYVIPYDGGIFELGVGVEQGLKQGSPLDTENNFYGKFNIQLRPPYLPVKNITGVLTTIYANQDYILFGEPETNGGIGYVVATWDEEIPSYKDIEWRIGSTYINQTTYPNTAGGTLNGNIIRATKAGKFTIQACIHSGKKEAIKWYDLKEQVAEAYTQLFTINVVAAEAASEFELAKLTMASGSTVSVKKVGDFSNLCTDAAADSNITIDGTTFKKSDVKKIDLWNEPSEGVRVTGVTGLPTSLKLNPVSDPFRGILSYPEYNDYGGFRLLGNFSSSNPDDYEGILFDPFSQPDTSTRVTGIVDPVRLSSGTTLNWYSKLFRANDGREADLFGGISYHDGAGDKFGSNEVLLMENYSNPLMGRNYPSNSAQFVLTNYGSILNIEIQNTDIPFMDLNEARSIPRFNINPSLINIPEEYGFSRFFSKSNSTLYGILLPPGTTVDKTTGTIYYYENGVKVCGIDIHGVVRYYNDSSCETNLILPDWSGVGNLSTYDNYNRPGGEANHIVYPDHSDNSDVDRTVLLKDDTKNCYYASLTGEFGIYIRLWNNNSTSSDDAFLDMPTEWRNQDVVDLSTVGIGDPGMNDVTLKIGRLDVRYYGVKKVYKRYVDSSTNRVLYKAGVVEFEDGQVISLLNSRMFHVSHRSITRSGAYLPHNTKLKVYNSTSVTEYTINGKVFTGTEIGKISRMDDSYTYLACMDKTKSAILDEDGMMYTLSAGTITGVINADGTSVPSGAFFDLSKRITSANVVPTNATNKDNLVRFEINEDKAGLRSSFHNRHGDVIQRPLLSYYDTSEPDNRGYRYVLVTGRDIGHGVVSVYYYGDLRSPFNSTLNFVERYDQLVSVSNNGESGVQSAYSYRSVSGINVDKWRTEGYPGQPSTFKVTLLGSDANTSTKRGAITVTCSGNTKPVAINKDQLASSGILIITPDASEAIGTKITVRLTILNHWNVSPVSAISDGWYAINEVCLTIVNNPILDVKSLRNFARNFTNLTTLNRIPLVTGTDCMRSFLRGCTNFNQALTIPEGVTGERCLMDFLRECTSFNSSVTIASTVTGNDCMHSFMYGCTSFNKPVTIPSGVTGARALEKAFMNCTVFNSAINIPSGISGLYCLRRFLSGCVKFNKPLTLPAVLKDEEYALQSMLCNCKDMCNTITVPSTIQGWSTNSLTFSTVYEDSAMFKTGIKLTGSGAAALKEQIENNTKIPRVNVSVV